MRRVVAGVDLTPESGLVVEQAVRCAHRLAAELYVAHVVPPGRSPGEPRRRLEALAARADGRSRAEPVVVTGGDPAEALAETAETLAADVLVVGGRRGWRPGRLFRASTVERVLRRARVDVLLAREAPRMAPDPNGWRRVLVCLDLDGSDAAVVRRAAELTRFGGALVLFHVLPWLLLERGTAVVSGGMVELELGRAARRHEADAALAAIEAALPRADAHVSREVAEGVAAVEIGRRLERGDCDLAVVPSQIGGRALEVVRRVARKARCALLAVVAD